MQRLKALVKLVGKEQLVLDLSCRKRFVSDVPGAAVEYVVVTDRWQKWTDFVVSASTLQELGQYCDEFLVHGVDVEGQQCGVEEGLVALLGQHSPVPVTYAGGVRNMQDIHTVMAVGAGRVDVTVGSALDIFGGPLPFQQVVAWHKAQNAPARGAAAAAAAVAGRAGAGSEH
jgi:phosphoribosylformimino-5-aminoimidazole carboxamide ribotide isomerase